MTSDVTSARDQAAGPTGAAGRAGMVIERDVPVPMDDGIVLRADVFRPPGPGRHPVLLSYGPYAKGLAFQDGYPDQWRLMVSQHPEVARGTSSTQQNWEVVDPEKWVPDGYACVRVDSRGAGRSPGVLEPFAPRETRDLYECIEWAAEQPWSTGKVGLAGISYYAMNQWHVAALHPPHLAAICVWEGAADFYRDATHHGGILCTFWRNWYDKQVTVVQHGMGERGPRSQVTGETGGRPGDAERGGPGRGAGAVRRADQRPAAGRRVLPAAVRRLRRDHRPVAVRGQLGRPGPALPGQLRGLQPGRVGAEMAGSARPGALDALLHRLRDRPAEAVLRAASCTATTAAGGTSHGSSCRSARWTGSSSAASRNGRWPAPSGSGSTCARRSAPWTPRRRPPTSG